MKKRRQPDGFIKALFEKWGICWRSGVSVGEVGHLFEDGTSVGEVGHVLEKWGMCWRSEPSAGGVGHLLETEWSLRTLDGAVCGLVELLEQR